MFSTHPTDHKFGYIPIGITCFVQYLHWYVSIIDWHRIIRPIMIALLASFLHTSSQHDDCTRIRFPYHTPEIIPCRMQWPLRYDEFTWGIVSLIKRQNQKIIKTLHNYLLYVPAHSWRSHNRSLLHHRPGVVWTGNGRRAGCWWSGFSVDCTANRRMCTVDRGPHVSTLRTPRWICDKRRICLTYIQNDNLIFVCCNYNSYTEFCRICSESPCVNILML